MKGIYQYMDLKTDDVVYVGKDSHIDKHKRHNYHLSPSKYDEQQINRVLQNNIDRYEYSVLYCSDDVSDDDLNMLEMSFIERYNPKFNFTKGGDGCTGFKHSNASKNKISESKKGKTFSDKHRKKLSMAKNTSGYLNVGKRKRKDIKQGFAWRYRYYEDGKCISFEYTDIEKLKAKVKSKGLKWEKLR